MKERPGGAKPTAREKSVLDRLTLFQRQLLRDAIIEGGETPRQMAGRVGVPVELVLDFMAIRYKALTPAEIPTPRGTDRHHKCPRHKHAKTDSADTPSPPRILRLRLLTSPAKVRQAERNHALE